MDPAPPQDPRPYPRPALPWVMHQRWHELLFAHWRVPAPRLRALIPPALTLETFAGEAWLGVVPFRMSNVRPRALPPLPGTSAFPELNVRTYVTDGKKPGVWFFSLDAANRLAVWAARTAVGLPYFHARMSVARDGDAVLYQSRRVDRRGAQARLEASYRPLAPAEAPVGSLTRWLTYRYCLYAVRSGRLLRVEIDHPPWPLWTAGAQLAVNTMAAPLELPLEGPPLLHYAPRLDVRIWPPQFVGG